MTFRSGLNDEKSQHLEAFGVLLCRLQEAYTDSDSDHYGLLVRLLQDQYTVQSKTVLPKHPKIYRPPLCSLSMT